MKKTAIIILGIASAFCLGFSYKNIVNKMPYDNPEINQPGNHNTSKKGDNMKLGAFSVSLNVKDLNASRQFYEKLGFSVFAGAIEKKYLIMKNQNCLIGLFHGMFEGNILTFNPGWDENAKNIENFDDVREIQRHLRSKGIVLTSEADEKTSGPASMTTIDPDGNVILIDQHR